MELVFDGKRSKDDILKDAASVSFPFSSVSLPVLFHGDNLDAMSFLLKDYKGRIDLVYIDPPYNTGNEFHLSDSRANAMSKESGSRVAYSDKMGKDEFLKFLYERLVLIHELLSERGSLYFHIGCKMGHYCKILLDEVFGEENFKNDIARIKSHPKNFLRKAYGNRRDMLLFYSKDFQKNIWNDIKEPLTEEEIEKSFPKMENGRRYYTAALNAPGETVDGETGKPWRGVPVPKGRHWAVGFSELDRLDSENRIEWSSTGNPRLKKYADEYEGRRIQDIWDFEDPPRPSYPTEKNHDMLQRIIRQSSLPDSIVMDVFAGSGSTLQEAHNLGRKWIGVDKSMEAIGVIQKRLSGKLIVQIQAT